MSMLDVLKSFIKNLVKAKSIDLTSDFSNFDDWNTDAGWKSSVKLYVVHASASIKTARSQTVVVGITEIEPIVKPKVESRC